MSGRPAISGGIFLCIEQKNALQMQMIMIIIAMRSGKAK